MAPRFLPSLSLRITVVALLLLPVTLSAEPDTPADTSPFDDFPQLDDRTGDTPPVAADRLPPLAAPDDGEEDPPAEPVELRLDLDESLTYQVVGQLRQSFEHRPDFETDYRSGLTVEYRPISEEERHRLPRWGVDLETDDDRPFDQSILMTVTDFSRIFDSPSHFRPPHESHQLMNQARLSFRLSDRGHLSDIRVHPPTNPLMRAGIEDAIRLSATSHPPLPRDPVEPGDKWSDSIDTTSSDEGTEQSYRLELDYEFRGWTRCGDHHCVVIDVDHRLDSSGRQESRHLINETVASGDGTARLVFDPWQGRIVSSHWATSAAGDTETTRRQEPDETIRHFDFQTEMETTMRLTGP